MTLTEQDYANAFGVTLPQEEPKNEPAAESEQEPAQDPAALEHEEQDQQETEPQEGHGDEEGQEPQGTEEQEPEAPDETDPATGKEALTPEQRAANAARRRKHEQQQAIDQAVAKARQEEQAAAAAQLAQVFRGMTDTYTGKPITTMEEYQAFQRKYQADQIASQLKEGTVTPEMIDQLIAQNPTVQKANAILAQAQQKSDQDAQIQAAMQRDLDAIARLDPAMKDLDTILESDLGERFKAHCTAGENFLQAFTNAREEVKAGKTAEKAVQQKQQQAQSKSHLRATGSTGGSAQLSVPAETMRYFRQLNPGMTTAQITEYYNKNMKK